jgi:hypothetical protein
MKLKGCNYVAQTHNLYLKIFRKLADSMKKIRLNTVNVLSQQIYCINEKSLWVRENLLMAAYGHCGHAWESPIKTNMTLELHGKLRV